MRCYCSFPIMGHNDHPDWVGKVISNKAAAALNVSFYNPWLNVLEQPIAAWLASKPNAKAVAYAEAYKLDPMLFAPISDPAVLARLQHADSGPNLDVPFKDLYVLLRSDVMITDLCSPSFGGTPQEVTFAYLWDIPIIGITDRFINSPWMMNKVKAVCSPRTSDDIMQLLLAYAPEQQQLLNSLSSRPTLNSQKEVKLE